MTELEPNIKKLILHAKREGYLDGLKKGRQEGIVKGRDGAIRKIIYRLGLDEIAYLLKMPIDYLREIESRMPVPKPTPTIAQLREKNWVLLARRQRRKIGAIDLNYGLDEGFMRAIRPIFLRTDFTHQQIVKMLDLTIDQVEQIEAMILDDLIS